MHIKPIVTQKIVLVLLGILSLAALGSATVFTTPVAAADSPIVTESHCTGDSTKCVPSCATKADAKLPECKKLVPCKNLDDPNCNVIKKYLNPFIKFMSAFAGIAIVIGIIWSGIKYSMSEGDPAKVALAKKRIRDSVIALLALLFLYAFLKFLIPGQIIG